MYKEFIKENAEKFADLQSLKNRGDLIERRRAKRWEEKQKRIEKWKELLNEEHAQF